MNVAPEGKQVPSRVQTAVVVVDPDTKVRDVLIEHVRKFHDTATGFDSLDEFVTATGATKPVVVVVGPSHEEDELFESVERLLSSRPACGVVMVVFQLTADLLRRALRSGVADVVEVTADDDELFGAIDRATGRLRVAAVEIAPISVPSEPPATMLGRVSTVFSTKGGTGKSVIAINLAAALALSTVQPVVLVDADLQFGDVALMLGLPPVHTILDAVQAGDRIDADLLSSIMLRHEASGLFVLAAPTEPGSAEQIGGRDLTRIISVLREGCAHIIIDTSANFGEVTLAALKEADDILVLASMDVMSLRSARVGLQTMRLLGIPFSRVKFVLNRANTRVGLTEADAGRALEMKVDVALPSELAVAESVNRGVPVYISSPRSNFTRGIRDLATSLMAYAPANRTA
jgi:pilus assembly protein CpaE